MPTPKAKQPQTTAPMAKVVLLPEVNKANATRKESPPPSSPHTGGTFHVFSACAMTDPAGPVRPVATAKCSSWLVAVTRAAVFSLHLRIAQAQTGHPRTQLPRSVPPKSPGAPNRRAPAPAEIATTMTAGSVTVTWPSSTALDGVKAASADMAEGYQWEVG